MIEPIGVSEQLLFSTVKIKTELVEGTAFFFNYIFSENGILPLIVTCRHVIENSKNGEFQVHEALYKDEKLIPKGSFFKVNMSNFSEQWIYHPDNNIDLCCLPIKPLFDIAKNDQKSIFHIPIDSSLIWDESKLNELFAIENIILIGYPIGLWDEEHNLPLIRKGITASHPALDFKNSNIKSKSIGVIDAACFPGSSGSPVLLFDQGMIVTKKGVSMGGVRICLLGLLTSGSSIDPDGKLTIREMTTRFELIIETKQMIHLGYYLKAKEIIELCKHALKVLNGLF